MGTVQAAIFALLLGFRRSGNLPPLFEYPGTYA